MFIVKIVYVLKFCFLMLVIEVMFFNWIECIRLKRSWMVKKFVIILEFKICVLFLLVLYYNIELKKK